MFASWFFVPFITCRFQTSFVTLALAVSPLCFRLRTILKYQHPTENGLNVRSMDHLRQEGSCLYVCVRSGRREYSDHFFICCREVIGRVHQPELCSREVRIIPRIQAEWCKIYTVINASGRVAVKM